MPQKLYKGHNNSNAGFTLSGIVSIVLIALSQGGPLEKISSEVTTRVWQDGVTVQSTSSLFYHTDGTLVIHTTEPEELIIKTNRLGEMHAYDPEDNTVEYEQNPDMSSETSQFFLFFQGLTDDMGLRRLGFRQSGTEFSDGNEISYWDPPPELVSHLSKAELVHRDYRPVYIAMHDVSDRIIQQTYFHSYTEILDHAFPQRITTIQYESEQDSLVMQTLFDKIKVNEQADSPFFNFQIPDDAQIIR
ncbi:MAG: hypothetical protein R6U28_06430 [Cyclonatronaceae bacterium]